MSTYKEGTMDRYQTRLIVLDQMVNENSFARVIHAFLSEAKPEYFNFKNASPKGIGNTPYNPLDLMALYLYGYRKSVCSSRKLQEQCRINLEVMWLLNGLVPDDKTICNFRTENKEGFEKCFLLFQKFCDAEGLFGKKVVSIDGTKIRASNGRKKMITQKGLEKKKKHYEKELNSYLAELNRNDGIEKNAEGKKEEIQKKLEEVEEQLREVKETGGQALTDPDCRYMKMNNNGATPGYNCQTVVDEKNHLIVTGKVTNNPTDRNELHKMAKAAKEQLGVETLTALADTGYFTGEELKKCKEEKINPVVCPTESRNQDGYGKDAFLYEEKEDVYICPKGHRLTKHGKKTPQYYNEQACRECADREKCTKSQKKVIVPTEYEKELIEGKENYQKNIELYKKRQQLSEHPFGTIKRGLGRDHFLLRTLPKVEIENTLNNLTYNLIRVVNIYTGSETGPGFDALLCRLKNRVRDIMNGNVQAA